MPRRAARENDKHWERVSPCTDASAQKPFEIRAAPRKEAREKDGKGGASIVEGAIDAQKQPDRETIGVLFAKPSGGTSS